MANNITAEEVKRLQEIERKQKERYKKQNEHTNKLYDRISFTVPKGRKKEIEAVASSNNITLNKFISEIILGILDNNVVINSILNNNIKTAQSAEIKPKTPKLDKSIKEPKKSEIKADATPQQKTKEETSRAEEPCPENGFDGLIACDWSKEKHNGIVPCPPIGTPENAIWNIKMQEWCECLPFD